MYQPMPGATMTTTMMVGSDWTSGIFDCFSDINSCIDVYFCPCCASARQYDAASGIPDSLNMLILLANVCLGTTYLVNCCVRCNVAARFAIPENSCCSCCWAMWFPTCSMCQTHRELSNRGLWPGGTICFAPPANYAPIVAPMGVGMVSPVMAVPPPGFMQPQRTYRERVAALLALYDPSKLSQVDPLLAKYEGKEEQVISVLVKKYGPEPPGSTLAEGFVQPQPVSAEY